MDAAHCLDDARANVSEKTLDSRVDVSGLDMVFSALDRYFPGIRLEPFGGDW